MVTTCLRKQPCHKNIIKVDQDRPRILYLLKDPWRSPEKLKKATGDRQPTHIQASKKKSWNYSSWCG